MYHPTPSLSESPGSRAVFARAGGTATRATRAHSSPLLPLRARVSAAALLQLQPYQKTIACCISMRAYRISGVSINADGRIVVDA